MKIILRIFAEQAIAVRQSNTRAVKGKVEGRLVREISSLCKQLGITDCEIWIDKIGRAEFSKEIPKEHYQKFRNVLSINS